jgi:hypothetical protein
MGDVKAEGILLFGSTEEQVMMFIARLLTIALVVVVYSCLMYNHARCCYYCDTSTCNSWTTY